MISIARVRDEGKHRLYEDDGDEDQVWRERQRVRP